MLSKKQILSAMAGLAMLALPISALAGDHDRDDWRFRRPFAERGEGLHRGWMRQAWRHDGWNGAPVQRAPIDFAPQAYRPYGSNDYDRDDWRGRGYGRRGYGNRPFSAMGPGCGTAWGNSPYQGGNNQSRSPGWLMAKRHNEMETISRLRARGDSRAAARLVPGVKALNQRIGTMNNGYGYNTGCGNGMAPSAGYYNGSYAPNPTMNAVGSVVAPMLGNIP